MSDDAITALFALIASIVGALLGGGGVAAFFKLRPENKRTFSEAGKADAEADEAQARASESLARAAKVTNETLLETVEKLKADYNTLRADYDLLKYEYGVLKRDLANSESRNTQKIADLTKRIGELEMENSALKIQLQTIGNL